SEANLIERKYLGIKERYDEVTNEVQKLKNENRQKDSMLQSVQKENEKLKNQLSEMGMIKKTRQITDEQVMEIKKLRGKGLSYRAIEKETGWSSVTINRAINGIYD
ncbi:MAG: hypothetical protein ACRDA5_02090, partial [Clostridium sp.]